jgi:general secretion pathway protein E
MAAEELRQRPRQKASFDLSYVLGILRRASLLTAEQAAEVSSRERLLRLQLSKERGAGRPYEASPIEIVAAFGAPAPGRQGAILDEDAVSEVVAGAAGVSYRKIDPLKLDMQLITRTLSRPYAERHAALPLSMTDGKLAVAVANPFDEELFDLLAQRVGVPVEPVLSAKVDILKSIEQVYRFRQSVAAVVDGGFVPAAQIGNLEQLVRLSSDHQLEASDKPVIAAVDYLLRYAFEQRASDIHLEPTRGGTAVRLRIDGVLHQVFMLPRGVHEPLLSRLKMLSRMDIAEKRRPQDGRIKTERNGREVEMRVSTIPTAFGEKTVLRIFDPEALAKDLTELGFADDERAVFQSWIDRPHGMILVTGPTGSGKTTTLYSALRILTGPDVNVTTIEDPIEMIFEGLNQIQVQPKIDLDFATAIRHILRQDPDIIMVGEIRDRETAMAAIQAALTGHLVLSTLHTNSAPEAIPRMRDLGIEPYLIASSVVGVMAQRLVRSVCPHCAEPTILSAIDRKSLGVALPEPAFLRKGAGCAKCRNTGYLGRSAIFELLSVTGSIRANVSSSIDVISQVAREEQQMNTLREAGARRVAAGTTTVEEVVRATSL